MKKILAILLTTMFALSLEAETYQVYDYETGRDYEIEVDKDGGATLYDYQTGEYRYVDVDVQRDNNVPSKEDLHYQQYYQNMK